MAKRRKPGKRAPKRAISSPRRGLLGIPARDRVTNQTRYANQRELSLGYGDYQVPLFSSAELASVKTRGTRPVKTALVNTQVDLFAKPRPDLCTTRSVRREVLFATGEGGKTGPQRPHRPKSKVRC